MHISESSLRLSNSSIEIPTPSPSGCEDWRVQGLLHEHQESSIELPIIPNENDWHFSRGRWFWVYHCLSPRRVYFLAHRLDQQRHWGLWYYLLYSVYSSSECGSCACRVSDASLSWDEIPVFLSAVTDFSTAKSLQKVPIGLHKVNYASFNPSDNCPGFSTSMTCARNAFLRTPLQNNTRIIQE